MTSIERVRIPAMCSVDLGGPVGVPGSGSLEPEAGQS